MNKICTSDAFTKLLPVVDVCLHITNSDLLLNNNASHNCACKDMEALA